MTDFPEKQKIPWIEPRSIFFLLGIVVLSLVIIQQEMKKLDHQMRETLLLKTRLVAKALNPKHIQVLTGTPADLNLPDYQLLKDHLICTKAVYEKCRFLYLMGKRKDGNVFFFVDSEPPGSENESPPGQVYKEISPKDMQAFTRKIELTSGPAEDRWGTWVSALVPLFDPDTGKLIAVFGMDYDALEWKQKLIRTILPLILLSLAMIIIFICGLILINRRSRSTDITSYRLLYLKSLLTIAITGAFLSLSLAWTFHAGELNMRWKAFHHLAEEKATRIETVFTTFMHIELEALARFFEASVSVDRNEFIKYTSALLQNPVISTWEWTQPVRLSKKNETEVKNRANGLARFTIWEYDTDGKQIPVGSRDIYYPVLQVSPLNENKKAIGFDLGSEPLRRTALELAIRTGYTTSSYPVTRTPETPCSKTITVFRPVYETETAPHLKGVIAAVLRPKKILAQEVSNEIITLELVMGHPVDAFESLSCLQDKTPLKNYGLSEIFPIYLFGKSFFIKTCAGSQFTRLHPVRTGWLAGVTGIILTILILGFVHVIHHKRGELEALVAKRTSELLDAKCRIELALVGADLGTWDWNVQTDEVILSENWADKLGYPADKTQIHLSGWYCMFHPEDRSAVIKALKEHAAGKADSYEAEHRLVHPSGNTIWVLSKGRAIQKTPEGETQRICGTYLDITERKKAEEALRASRTHLRTLIDTLPALIWLKDPNGVYLSCNRRFERFFGARENEIIGRTDYDYVNRPLADFFREKDKTAMSAGKPCRNEEEVTYADDGHHEILETLKTPMFDAQGKIIGVLGIARDITALKTAEKEREKLLKQLNQSQRMEAIGRLAGGVAHDLNNLLSPIIGYAEILLQDMESGDKNRSSVENILNTGIRARDLVAQLLAYSRKQILAFEPVDINAVIKNLIPLLTNSIPEDITITTRFSDEIQQVMADTGQIEQVLKNLTVNAAAAMPGGGCLTITTTVKKMNESDVASSRLELTPGTYVMMIISDEGCGMDAETREHIFEPFFSTKDEMGTGLGLSTVFGIIRQHNGNIRVFSEPGEGTSFEIYLPVAGHVPADLQKQHPPHSDG